MSKSQQEKEQVQQMRDLARLPENCRCADCDSKDPDWTSINLGVFICIKCAGIHRNLGVHHSKVRSIELDTSVWDGEMIAYMRRMGNEKARRLFESRAPAFYIRPKEYDLSMIRERWIRAKYEKRLFVRDGDIVDDEDAPPAALTPASASPARPSPIAAATASPSASSGTPAHAHALGHDPAIYLAPERATEGWLYKENKHKKWQKRWFQLWGRELHYFKDAGDSYEKGRIDVVHCRIYIPDGSGGSAASSAANGTPTGFRYLFELVSTEQDRSYPLATETEDEMFNWLHAIRRAIIFYTKIAKADEASGYVDARLPDLKLPFAKIGAVNKKGFLSKQGGGWASWNKRFFVLTKDTLYYYKNPPADADLAEGAIALDAADIQFGEDKIKRKNVFTILTPNRTYFIQANSEQEMTEWMNTLQAITDLAQKRREVDYADSLLR